MPHEVEDIRQNVFILIQLFWVEIFQLEMNSTQNGGGILAQDGLVRTALNGYVLIIMEIRVLTHGGILQIGQINGHRMHILKHLELTGV